MSQQTSLFFFTEEVLATLSLIQLALAHLELVLGIKAELFLSS